MLGKRHTIKPGDMPDGSKSAKEGGKSSSKPPTDAKAKTMKKVSPDKDKLFRKTIKTNTSLMSSINEKSSETGKTTKNNDSSSAPK